MSLPATPQNRDELLIAALDHANRVSATLNLINATLTQALGTKVDSPKYDRVFDLLRRRFNEDSGVALFIAADALDIDLPEHLRVPHRDV